MSDSPVSIRTATPEDVPAIHGMILELAEYEKLAHEFVATVEDLTASFFGDEPPAESLVAEVDPGQPIGYAIFFKTFSTFLAKPGLWLEDLYVKPDFRGRGIGKGLLLAVGKIAHERGCGRYEWNVLDWNRRAIEVYEKAGAKILEDWRVVRLDREGIERLGNQSS